MAKIRFTALAGVIAVYPQGQAGDARVLHESESMECEVPLPPDDNAPAKVLADYDRSVPCAGVAKDEPVGKRSGIVTVSGIDADVLLRVYEGSDFSEHVLHQDGSYDAAVTESNAITVAVYLS